MIETKIKTCVIIITIAQNLFYALGCICSRQCFCLPIFSKIWVEPNCTSPVAHRTWGAGFHKKQCSEYQDTYVGYFFPQINLHEARISDFIYYIFTEMNE